MPKNIDTVIWDADNTLWDWIKMHLEGMRSMSQKIAQVTGISEDEVKGSMAKVYGEAGTFDYKSLVQEMDVVEKWAAEIGSEREKVKRIIDLAFAVHTSYTHARKRTFQTYPEVPETLQEFHEAGIRNVVLSDAPIGKIIRRVKHFKLDPYFDLICGREDPLVEEERRLGEEDLKHYESTRRQGGVYETSVPIRVLSGQKKPNVDLAELLSKTPEEVQETVIMGGDNFFKDVGTAFENGCYGFFARYGAADSASINGLHEFAPTNVVTRNAAGIDLNKDNLRMIHEMGDKLITVDRTREVLEFVLAHNAR